MIKSLVKYLEDMNMKPVEEMVGKDKSQFIQNVVDENKRMQIWMTNGISGDKKYLQNANNVGNLHLSDNNSLRVI